MPHELGYNERLFSGSGLRNYYHLARYRWLQKTLSELPRQEPLSVVELGCFDAKSLNYLPVRPQQYVGLDANWENGLEIGRRAFGDRPEVTFIEATDPSPLHAFKDGTFNLAVALETLEHIPDPIMREYLAELARVTNGYFLISVPNEMGPVFLVKHLMKVVTYGGVDDYSVREVVAATLRQPHKVARDQHKGFDYRALIADIERHFDIERVEGVPSMGLPPALSLTVGIVARSRRRH